MERLENCPRVVQLMSRGTMDPLRTPDTSVILPPPPQTKWACISGDWI